MRPGQTVFEIPLSVLPSNTIYADSRWLVRDNLSYNRATLEFIVSEYRLATELRTNYS